MESQAEEADSVPQAKHTSVEVGFAPLRVLKLDSYVKRWLQTTEAYRASVEFTQHQPSGPLLSGRDSADVNLFRRQLSDYNHPSITFGLAYHFNHAVRMHKDKDVAWGQLVPVDYVSRLGDAIAVYGRFNRPLYRSRRLEWNYYLGMGAAYALSYYNREDAIDDEFIGSRLNIYFTFGTYAELMLSRQLALQAGFGFSHYSNGALARPNKGVNYISPFVGLSVRTSDQKTPMQDYRGGWGRPYWFMELTAGIGGKTMLEDWQRAQFQTSPDDPDYRKTHYTFYGAYSLQADVLCRYAPRWASGFGIDLFYGDYSNHIAQIDAAEGHDEKHSPWSVGVALKHEVFFGRLSARMGIGYYLFREMGYDAKTAEKRYYERIGLHYSFPSLGGLSLGFNVNAHKTRADYTELQLTMPIVFGRR